MLVSKEIIILSQVWKFSGPARCISKQDGCEPACQSSVNHILETTFQQSEKITYLSIEQTQTQEEAGWIVGNLEFQFSLWFYVGVSGCEQTLASLLQYRAED